MPASYVVEFYDCVPGCRVSWPRAKNDESADHMIKCRVCWPHAKNDESAGHVLKRRVSWPRAKNDESAGQVLKRQDSLNDYNHNICASNNAFINQYHLFV